MAAPGLGRTRPWRGHCSPGPGIGRVTQASCGQLDWVVEDARGIGSLRCFRRCAGPAWVSPFRGSRWPQKPFKDFYDGHPLTRKGGRGWKPRAGKGEGRACEGRVGLRQLRNWSQILLLSKRMDRALHSTITPFGFLLFFKSCFSDPQPPFGQPVASLVLFPCPDPSR